MTNGGTELLRGMNQKRAALRFTLGKNRWSEAVERRAKTHFWRESPIASFVLAEIYGWFDGCFIN